MSQFITNRVEKLTDTEESLASQITTKAVNLANYQSAKVVIETAPADEAITTARVIAILPDETEQEIKTQEIIVGSQPQNEVNVVANELAHYDATKFKVVFDAIEGSELKAAIVVLLGEPRYSIENDKPVEGDEIVTPKEDEVVTEPSGGDDINE